MHWHFLRFNWWSLAYVGLNSVACVGSGDESKDADAGASRTACEPGNETCECYPNDTCNSGLECFSGLCVNPNEGAEDVDSGLARKDASASAIGAGSESKGGASNTPATDDGSDADDAVQDTNGDEGPRGNDDTEADGAEYDDAEADDPGDASDDTDESQETRTDDVADDGSDPDESDDGQMEVDDPATAASSCTMTIEAIFRDFSESHADFGDHVCGNVTQGAVAATLDVNGRPVMGSTAAAVQACMSSASNFAEWYTDGDHNLRVEKDIVLFDDGRGGFVNRFGPNGETFDAVEDDDAFPGGATLEECEDSCRNYVAQNEFNASCDNYCNAEDATVQQLAAELADWREALDDPSLLANDAGVSPSVEEIEAELDELEEMLTEAEAASDECHDVCEAGIDAGAEECASTCMPCSFSSGYCTGGTLVRHDGTPLFFPLDDVTGPTADAAPAKVPWAYGYAGWPWEDDIFPGAPDHNFYFTTEIQTTLDLQAGSTATLEFVGDDDLWVFINGRLALDVGGLHVPAGGTVTIDTTSGTVSSDVSVFDSGETYPFSVNNWPISYFDLVPGNRYAVSIFHAERQMEGSSFKLRLVGFDASSVECPE